MFSDYLKAFANACFHWHRFSACEKKSETAYVGVSWFVY